MDSAASTWLGKSRLERTKLVGLGQDGCGTLCSAGLASACLSWARVGSSKWNSLPLAGLEQIRLGTGGARMSWTGFGLAGLGLVRLKNKFEVDDIFQFNNLI